MVRSLDLLKINFSKMKKYKIKFKLYFVLLIKNKIKLIFNWIFVHNASTTSYFFIHSSKITQF